MVTYLSGLIFDQKHILFDFVHPRGVSFQRKMNDQEIYLKLKFLPILIPGLDNLSPARLTAFISDNLLHY